MLSSSRDALRDQNPALYLYATAPHTLEREPKGPDGDPVLRSHEAAHAIGHISRIIGPVGTILVFGVVGIVGVIVPQGSEERPPRLRVCA